MLAVFFKVKNETEILFQEIAWLGMQKNCPVMSNDSDFFIFSVDYIKLSSIDIEGWFYSTCKFLFFVFKCHFGFQDTFFLILVKLIRAVLLR